MNKELIINNESIKNKIHFIRGKYVMLDYDLAKLYELETKRLNEQVKRNKKRFPEDFMFQLNNFEKEELVAKCDQLKLLKHSYKNPFVFTENGVAMLSSVLRSDKAIEINIKIMRAFITIKKIIYKNKEIFYRLDNVEKKQIEYKLKTDKNFEKVFD